MQTNVRSRVSWKKSVGFSEDPDKDAALQAQAEKDFDVFSSWRPMRRFVIWQDQHGDVAAPATAIFSGHNDTVPIAERVHTARPARAAAVARHVKLVAHLSPTSGHPPVLTGGCDDEKSVFRWKGALEADRCLTIVAYWGST